MRITSRHLGWACVFLTPVILSATTAIRWHGSACAGSVHESVVLFMLYAALLAASNNPWRAVAASIAYLPIGYIFTTEPCTAPRSQGAGGLIYLLTPLFILYILLATLVGGWLLRVLAKAVAPTETQAAISNQP